MTIKPTNYPTTRPSLNLNFAQSKQLDPRVSFSRASTGTYVGSDGLMKTAPNGVPRFDHDPVTGESLGLLVEASRTNLLLNSATLATQSVTVSAVVYTLSFYGTGTVVLSGTHSATVVGTGAYPSRTVLTFTPTAGSLTLTVTGTVESAQLEAGAFLTSYIPTTGSTATRAADVASVTNSGVYDKDSFTILNQPYGVSTGTSSLSLAGPVVERVAVYDQELSQSQINAAVGKFDNFWRWRILGSSFALSSFVTDGQVTVDWGDGTVETLTTSEHTFTNGGGYHDVGFRLDSGNYFRPNINNNATHRTKVVATGPAPAGMKLDANVAFYGCSGLRAVDATIDATGGTTFSNAWRGCSSLTNFPLIDTFSATTFSNAWRDCTSLTNFPLIDTSSTTAFGGAWFNCSSLTSFPLIDTSNGTTFQNAWFGCSSLTSFPLIDTSSGTNFNNAWYLCSSLTSFPLIDTSAGTLFQSTWQNCSSLTSFPLIDTSSGTNFQLSWGNCSSLISFPLIDTSNGTTFQQAWQNCSSLTSFPLIDTSSGTNFAYAWFNCSSLTSFPLIDTSSGTNFQQAWFNCSSLTTFPAGFFDTWTGTPANSCFVNAWDGCADLTATSVENILNSIDTSGQSAPASGVDITIDYDAGSGTPSVATAVTNLKGRGWTITLNGVAQ